MRDCKINALDLDLLVVGRECHLYGEAFVVDCEKRDNVRGKILIHQIIYYYAYLLYILKTSVSLYTVSVCEGNIYDHNHMPKVHSTINIYEAS